MRRILLTFSVFAAVGSAAVLMWASLTPLQAKQGAVADSVGDQHMAQAGESPKQPILFSHKIHAGDNGIPCLYCHVGADDGAVAAVPAVQTCMGCHKMVGTTIPDVQKLAKYWENKQPIPWVKVHDVPDHVRFTHKRHVLAGIACQTCHGPIQEESVVKLRQNLTMGFCVKCHKERLNDAVHATSLDCSTCHK